MAAANIRTLGVIIPNPNITTDSNVDRIPSSISFNLEVDNNLRTLSTTTARASEAIVGLLYVPDLPPDNTCIALSEPYVPSNATRLADLPAINLPIIALAPWISADCTLSYLAAARQDVIETFIFFPTDHRPSQPPSIDDRLWDLGDRGQWKSENRFPVYAVPGQIGDTLMYHLSRYSGNMSQVEYGQELVQAYDERDYARLYTVISTARRTALPSLWIFLLIVVAAILFIVALMSFSMHWWQKHRRNALRRRVLNGEVDLETLGITRVTVPKEALDRLPLSTYAPNDGTELPEGVTKSPPTTQAFNQPTCAICLDDFVPHSTPVRHLPCSHIFHPDCIDDFLLKTSSLCPVCKSSVLPRGYCPKVITNLMVRNERVSRRRRQNGAGDRRAWWDPRGLPAVTGRGLRRVRGQNPPPSSTIVPPRSSSAAATMEMTSPDAPHSRTTNRREWARHRAGAMLGLRPEEVRGDANGDGEAPTGQERSKWRKAVRTIFPTTTTTTTTSPTSRSTNQGATV
ncbi:MAG: hypothetical protein M1817_000314 [Caeruleum heppii]|nr:MAG: hypothetical protein M1817_000314 [Caeruleum heppii]